MGLLYLYLLQFLDAGMEGLIYYNRLIIENLCYHETFQTNLLIMCEIRAHEPKLSRHTSADSKLLMCLIELFPSRRLSLICQFEASVFQNLRW
jgi:hypothetical protein